MKQTAVEWLIEQLKELKIPQIDLLPNTIEYAKRMEKDKIEEAYNNGVKDATKTITHNV